MGSNTLMIITPADFHWSHKMFSPLWVTIYLRWMWTVKYLINVTKSLLRLDIEDTIWLTDFLVQEYMVSVANRKIADAVKLVREECSLKNIQWVAKNWNICQTIYTQLTRKYAQEPCRHHQEVPARVRLFFQWNLSFVLCAPIRALPLLSRRNLKSRLNL